MEASYRLIFKTANPTTFQPMTKPIGLIIDQGNSPIDGKPYVAIATLKSKNKKTGNMVQVWIIRSDISPLDAIASGQDYSICGNCPHRGVIGDTVSANQKIERSCYVNVGREVMAVWKAYQAKNIMEHIGQKL